MGRYNYNAKTTVEDATQLCIFKLKEFGLLCGYVELRDTQAKGPRDYCVKAGCQQSGFLKAFRAKNY